MFIGLAEVVRRCCFVCGMLLPYFGPARNWEIRNSIFHKGSYCIFSSFLLCVLIQAKSDVGIISDTFRWWIQHPLFVVPYCSWYLMRIACVGTLFAVESMALKLNSRTILLRSRDPSNAIPLASTTNPKLSWKILCGRANSTIHLNYTKSRYNVNRELNFLTFPRLRKGVFWKRIIIHFYTINQLNKIKLFERLLAPWSMTEGQYTWQ